MVTMGPKAATGFIEVSSHRATGLAATIATSLGVEFAFLGSGIGIASFPLELASLVILLENSCHTGGVQFGNGGTHPRRSKRRMHHLQVKEHLREKRKSNRLIPDQSSKSRPVQKKIRHQIALAPTGPESLTDRARD
ncbi:hypothetical protein Acr_00g0011240 [Actinidia rufa]|uniref:Uncharacterized protein n=1 Tax=Actinidia rufa TaxID=165716 RepID=A0A7J0D9D2_9ERIC|nr:hypothetical protein Acr_00g0011240 [Actinidia rufa]